MAWALARLSAIVLSDVLDSVVVRRVFVEETPFDGVVLCALSIAAFSRPKMVRRFPVACHADENGWWAIAYRI